MRIYILFKINQQDQAYVKMSKMYIKSLKYRQLIACIDLSNNKAFSLIFYIEDNLYPLYQQLLAEIITVLPLVLPQPTVTTTTPGTITIILSLVNQIRSK